MMVMNGGSVNYKGKPKRSKLAKKWNEENVKNEDGIKKVQGRGKKAELQSLSLNINQILRKVYVKRNEINKGRI